jgi:hypothetical protein
LRRQHVLAANANAFVQRRSGRTRRKPFSTPGRLQLMLTPSAISFWFFRCPAWAVTTLEASELVSTRMAPARACLHGRDPFHE